MEIVKLSESSDPKLKDIGDLVAIGKIFNKNMPYKRTISPVNQMHSHFYNLLKPIIEKDLTPSISQIFVSGNTNEKLKSHTRKWMKKTNPHMHKKWIDKQMSWFTLESPCLLEERVQNKKLLKQYKLKNNVLYVPVEVVKTYLKNIK